MATMIRDFEERVRYLAGGDPLALQELLDAHTVVLLADLVAVMRHRHANKWAGLAERQALAALDAHTRRRKK